MYALYLFTYFAISFGSPTTARGASVRSLSSLNSLSFNDSKNLRFQKPLDCKTKDYEAIDVTLMKNSIIFIESINKSFSPSEYRAENKKYHVCDSSEKTNVNEDLKTCVTVGYEPHEYHIFENGTAFVYGDLLELGRYRLEGKKLVACADLDERDYDSGELEETEPEDKTDIYIGQIGSSISIVALSAHLAIFCCVPSLRNLPGYNLASLSLAFLLAYFFLLFGQIPQILGVPCIISGLLQQYFFLAAFFCMNAMAFDIWRTLKLATEKLIIGNNNFKKRQFLCYSIYVWGVPLAITIISAVVDNTESTPEHLKPGFGKRSVCWMTNEDAQTIFFVVPAFSLVLINFVFFILSFVIIKRNTMKCSADKHSQTITTNYFLYARLGVMMGITWLMGIIGILTKSRVVWIIFDVLNSLQGLFLFLLFTCSRKVFKHFSSKKISSEATSSDKQSTFTSKIDSQ